MDALSRSDQFEISAPQSASSLRLSGLEPLNITRDFGFAVIGERTNITGSPKFSKLILAGDFEGAVAVARQQVANGAQYHRHQCRRRDARFGGDDDAFPKSR